MIREIIKQCKTNLAQVTDEFSTNSTDVDLISHKNILTIAGLNGEYTITGGVDGIATKACMNNTFIFKDGKTVTNSFFGDDPITHPITHHKVSVGSAFRRDTAIQTMANPDLGNYCIVYLDDASRISKPVTSAGLKEYLEIKYTVGVLSRIKAVDMVDCPTWDRLLIDCLQGIYKSGTTPLSFTAVRDRLLSGDSYVVDLMFEYSIDVSRTNKVKHFDGEFEEFKI